MQQYFSEVPLEAGGTYIFTKEQAHHARDVVRLDREKVRLVYEGKAFFGICRSEGKDFIAEDLAEDPRVNENHADIILAPALIRREKFEFVLQKACELGVSRIIPFVSSRCVVKAKSEKAEKTGKRWNDIVREAAQQCKRNRIPEVTEILSFEELLKTEAECRIAAYENAYGKSASLSDLVKKQRSFLIVIGPEGGFSEEEMARFMDEGFIAATLGSRILRAETASLTACAVTGELSEKAWSL